MNGATTGMGSLPHADVGAALDLAFAVEVPYLPQLSCEPMVAAALEGLPGALGSAVDVALWRAGKDELDARLDAALSSGELGPFEPMTAAWRPFLARLSGRGKVQIAGPATVRWAAGIADRGELDYQVYRLITLKAKAMARAVRQRAEQAVIFLDEPGLGVLYPEDPRHRIILSELRLLAASLRREGVVVGVHCCANTRWDALLELGFDVLSFDARLSLDALVEHVAAVTDFIERGGILSIGVIPTEPGATYRVPVLVDAVDATLRAAVPARLHARLFSQLMLTPACGLAGHTPESAARVHRELAQAQALMRRLTEPLGVRC